MYLASRPSPSASFQRRGAANQMAAGPGSNSAKQAGQNLKEELGDITADAVRTIIPLDLQIRQTADLSLSPFPFPFAFLSRLGQDDWCQPERTRELRVCELTSILISPAVPHLPSLV